MKDDNFLKENNARHLWHPMGHPGDAQINAPKIIKGADGAHITDIDGHRVVDAVGGLWCVNLGYSNDVVKDAIAGQLYQLPYYSAFAGTSNPTAIEASYAVREFFADDGMSRVFFTSGGSDSVETCLTGAAVSSLAWRTHPQQVSIAEKRLSWHSFWRRFREW